MAGVAHSNGDWIACDNLGAAWTHLTFGAPAAVITEAPTDGWVCERLPDADARAVAEGRIEPFIGPLGKLCRRRPVRAL
jgi:hypothetical protein